MAAVSGQKQAGAHDERGTDDGKPDHEVPGRRRVTERVREVVPEPVLDVVHEREEEGRDEGGGDPDRRTEEHEVEIRATAHRRRRVSARGRLLRRWGRVGHWRTERVPATI